MPAEQYVVKGQVRDAHGSGDQTGKECEARMRFEEFSSGGEEVGMQDFFHARQINFRVFRIRMIAVNSERSEGEKYQREDGFGFLQKVERKIRPDELT